MPPDPPVPAFRLGPLDFVHEGFDAGAGHLAAYYARFPRASAVPDPGRPRVLLLHDDGRIRWRVDGRACGEARLADPALAGPVASALVLRLLAEAVPGLVVLHANALADPDGGRLLVLAGGSGAGKSTLGRVAASAGGWRRVCEDAVLLAPGDPVEAIPYPRAASLREAPGGDAEALPWWGGPLREPKWMEPPAAIEPPAPAESLRPAPADSLRPARVDFAFLKRRRLPVDAPPPAEFRLLLSWDDGRIARAWADAGLAAEALGCSESGARFRLPAEPPPDALARMQAIAEEHGGLVLAAAPKATAPPPAERPAAPRIEPAAALDSLRRIVRAQVRFRPGGGADVPTLARMLRDARFWTLEPGGTPEATFDLLAEAIRC